MSITMSSDRKSSYKLPPTTIRDKLVSQDARRNKALEDQKRRRAQRIDSTRQLDLFAGLTLESDDENADAQTIATEDDDGTGFTVAPTSVAQYASLLSQDNPSPEHELNVDISPSIASISNLNQIDGEPSGSTSNISPTQASKKKRSSNKNKLRTNKSKPSKWADRCMYAELLEMNADVPWDIHPNSYGANDDHAIDGLPTDIESGWVAVAPVPVGKRCLAVTQQSAGVSGIVPNTTLRSRLLGKGLLARFPSALPPLTVLDCILDSRWRENGILHVLDVVKWKGQDVADCEAGFRFWWRDTRLSELANTPPPASINFLTVQSSETSSGSNVPPKYHFPYPTSFIPVPYHSNTTLLNLEHEIIPAARMWREVNVSVPVAGTSSMLSGMEVEPLDTNSPFSFSSQRQELPTAVSSLKPQITLTPAPVRIEPDGMLLYVSEASYEPGTSPLSSWVPIKGYDDEEAGVVKEGPLDLFRRLVCRRISRQIPPQPILPRTGLLHKGQRDNGDVEMGS